MTAVNRDHQIFDVRRRTHAPVHRRQVKMIIFLHHAGGREEIVFRQRVAHVRQTESGGLQFQRVNDDVKFRLRGRR